jgi:hypothetical protein
MLAEIRRLYGGRPGVLLAEDVSGGQEAVPIPVVNEASGAGGGFAPRHRVSPWEHVEALRATGPLRVPFGIGWGGFDVQLNDEKLPSDLKYVRSYAWAPGVGEVVRAAGLPHVFLAACSGRFLVGRRCWTAIPRGRRRVTLPDTLTARTRPPIPATARKLPSQPAQWSSAAPTARFDSLAACCACGTLECAAW